MGDPLNGTTNSYSVLRVVFDVGHSLQQARSHPATDEHGYGCNRLGTRGVLFPGPARSKRRRGQGIPAEWFQSVVLRRAAIPGYKGWTCFF